MNLSAEGKGRRRPRQAEQRRNPFGQVLAQLGVLQQVDDDREQAEHAAGGNESAGVKRAGTDFAFGAALFLLLRARRASAPILRQTSPWWWRSKCRNPPRRAASGFPAARRRSPEKLPENTSRHGKPLIQDAADHGGHQARLRSGGLRAADSLHPLHFDLPRGRDRRDTFRRELRLSRWRSPARSPCLRTCSCFAGARRRREDARYRAGFASACIARGPRS